MNRLGPPGIHNVGSYQASGIPWITGSSALAAGQEEKVAFPYVTKKITVMNHGSQTLRLYFNSTGSGNGVDKNANIFPGMHFIELGSGAVQSHSSSISMDIKCSELYVYNSGSASTSYRVIAELTNIPHERMGSITGSGLTE